MARTLKSLIFGITSRWRNMGPFVSPGIIYSEANEKGYTGNADRLLEKADNMARQGILIAKQMGMPNVYWYSHARFAEGGN